MIFKRRGIEVTTPEQPFSDSEIRIFEFDRHEDEHGTAPSSDPSLLSHCDFSGGSSNRVQLTAVGTVEMIDGYD